MKHRTVDPYRDTTVVDARAPRFTQAVIGILALVAFLTGLWPLLAILAAQLAVGVTLNSSDAAEGVAAFLDKRDAAWTGS